MLLQLWKEWDQGLNNQRSLQDLERCEGSKWRTGHKVQWSIQKKLINYLSTLAEKRGINGEQAAILLRDFVSAETQPSRDKYRRWIDLNGAAFLAPEANQVYRPLKDSRKV